MLCCALQNYRYNSFTNSGFDFSIWILYFFLTWPTCTLLSQFSVMIIRKSWKVNRQWQAISITWKRNTFHVERGIGNLRCDHLGVTTPRKNLRSLSHVWCTLGNDAMHLRLTGTDLTCQCRSANWKRLMVCHVPTAEACSQLTGAVCWLLGG